MPTCEVNVGNVIRVITVLLLTNIIVIAIITDTCEINFYFYLELNI